MRQRWSEQSIFSRLTITASRWRNLRGDGRRLHIMALAVHDIFTSEQRTYWLITKERLNRRGRRAGACVRRHGRADRRAGWLATDDINRRAATPEIGDEIVSGRHARHEGAISGEMRTRFTSCKTIVHRTDGRTEERANGRPGRQYPISLCMTVDDCVGAPRADRLLLSFLVHHRERLCLSYSRNNPLRGRRLACHICLIFTEPV